MRHIIKIRKIFIVVMIVLLASCTQDFESTNVDPNRPSSVPTTALVTSAEKQLMDHIWDQWHNGRFGMLYAQYWAQNNYTDESRYSLRQNINNNYWLYYYAGRDVALDGAPNGGGIADLQEVININNKEPLKASKYGDPANQIAVARILKVWMFEIITDVWGDVPYFDALKGAASPNPKYTKQAEIYADLLKELKEAQAQINLDKDGFTSGDLIYGGKMSNWKKFANSLRLRVAMRMSDREPNLAATEIKDAIAAGIFTSNDDNALLKYLSDVPNNNPLNQDRKTRKDFAVSDVIIERMKSTADPRLPAYADPASSTGTFIGKPYGASNGEAASLPVSSFSQPAAKTVLSPTSPGVFMDYAEVQFILAEAVARGFITGDAKTYYNNGITASLNYWGVKDAAVVNAYLLSPSVAYNSSNWKQSIGEQKWLAMYMQGIQGWTEWRRLDFVGILKKPKAGYLGGASNIPTRITYPTDEQNLNKANYMDAVNQQGPDALNTRVWWDVAENPDPSLK